jgi:hypothetical protein
MTASDPFRDLLRTAIDEQDCQRFTELLVEIQLFISKEDEARRIQAPEATVVQSSSKSQPDVFDIFSGDTDRDALWIEAAPGIEQARQRMGEIAAATPGSYFLFHTATRQIVERVSSAQAISTRGEKLVKSKSA